MKRIFLLLTILSALCADAQIVNRFRDSTIFYGSVRMDSIVRITKGAAAGKVLTSSANGTATWQQPASDSIVFYNGITRSNDSVKLGGTLKNGTDIYYNSNYLNFFDTTEVYNFGIGNLTALGGTENMVSAFMQNIILSGDTSLLLLSATTITGTSPTVDILSGDPAGDNARLLQHDVDAAFGRPDQSLEVKDSGIVYGLYSYYNSGQFTANIYTGVDTGGGVFDISRVESNINEIHGRHIIDKDADTLRYNGWQCAATYSQLEYRKEGEDGTLTGNVIRLDSNGLSWYVQNTLIFRIGNTIPTYADDAAAAAGGVAVNQVYKTTTGGSTFLKIRQ